MDAEVISLLDRRELAFRSTPITAPEVERLRVTLHNCRVMREMARRRGSRICQRDTLYYDSMIWRLQRRLDTLVEKSDPEPE